MATTLLTALPPSVSRHSREQADTQAADSLVPVDITKPYEFDSAGGKVSLADLFEGRSHLIVCTVMLAPDGGPGCAGYTQAADHAWPEALPGFGEPARVLVSHAPLPVVLDCQERLGWTQRWVSSFASDFARDLCAFAADGQAARYNVFRRDGERILHMRPITRRGALPYGGRLA